MEKVWALISAIGWGLLAILRYIGGLLTVPVAVIGLAALWNIKTVGAGWALVAAAVAAVWVTIAWRVMRNG